MSKEKEMIEMIQKHMPKSSMQLNKLFQSDAEIIDFHGKKLVYSIDEFSEEDMFRYEDPYILGWNMAVGTISDIYACGGTPEYYAHSITVNHSCSFEYVEQLAMGISDVLKKTGTFFIGGDISYADVWRYTGSIIGILNDKPILRKGSKINDDIFISGEIGSGNIEAALKLYSDYLLSQNNKNMFTLRNKEAYLIRQYCNCCIDTSDGVYRALTTISDINKTGYELRGLPYRSDGILLADSLNLPKEMLFVGECGEYELLFTIDKEKSEVFLENAAEKNLKFYKIGEVREKGIKQLHTDNQVIDLGAYHLNARDYQDKKAYLKDILEFLIIEKQEPSL